ncbi:MAG: hypothetical protein U5L02_11380 [Rheinheimera sp.]|nr:hypothetical protein [Rheinheimera sp.]
MCIVLHVVIDVQFHLFDVGVLVGLARQMAKRGLVELLKPFAPVTAKLFKGPCVDLLKQGFDAMIQLGQREEGMVTQPR